MQYLGIAKIIIGFIIVVIGLVLLTKAVFAKSTDSETASNKMFNLIVGCFIMILGFSVALI